MRVWYAAWYNGLTKTAFKLIEFVRVFFFVVVCGLLVWAESRPGLAQRYGLLLLLNWFGDLLVDPQVKLRSP